MIAILIHATWLGSFGTIKICFEHSDQILQPVLTAFDLISFLWTCLMIAHWYMSILTLIVNKMILFEVNICCKIKTNSANNFAGRNNYYHQHVIESVSNHIWKWSYLLYVSFICKKNRLKFKKYVGGHRHSNKSHKKFICKQHHHTEIGVFNFLTKLYIFIYFIRLNTF